MAFTLPTLSATIDQYYLTQWQALQPLIADNAIVSTPVWAALKKCLKSEAGGSQYIRPIRTNHGPAPTSVTPTSELPTGTSETLTYAKFFPKYHAVPITRNTIKDDVWNRGKESLITNINEKMDNARKSIEDSFDSLLFDTIDTSEATTLPQGLNTMIPLIASATTGTYGLIARPTTYTGSYPTAGNTFWGPVYLSATAGTQAIALKMDMTTLHNNIKRGRESYKPNLGILDQTLYELYEQYAESKSTIVKGTGTELANLGFDSLYFKGMPLIYSENATANHVLFLNTNYIEIPYDPMTWFAMSEWKISSALSYDRICHITNGFTLLTDRPSAHGRLYYA